MAQELDEKFLHEPLLTTPYNPPDFTKTPWRDLNTPRAFVFVGDKRSGKDMAMDMELQITLMEKFTNLKIFDGGGHESLYVTINKNCREKWRLVDEILLQFEENEQPTLTESFIMKKTGISRKIFDTLIGLMVSHGMLKKDDDNLTITFIGIDELDGNLLHCNCHGSFPVIVIKPPYVKYSREQLDRFNGYNFRNYHEYTQAFMKGLVSEMLPPNTDFTKIRKPKSMISRLKPKLRIVEAPVPRGSREKINKFIEIFTRELLNAREYGALLVGCDPAMYPPDHEGRLDKYHTFATIMDNLKPIADRHFIPLMLDKPRNKWTLKEKAYHKISLLVSEVRKPVPNQSISPEPEASVSKRAFFGFMPESRHAKCFPKVNAQSLGDVLKGVNKQQDIIIVKRSSERNLGDELGWLAVDMDKEIEKQLIKWKIWKVIDGKVIKIPISTLIKRKLIEEKGLCKISELPDNRAIIVNGNKQWRMEKYNPPAWHHKSDRDEFTNDTGIELKFDKDVVNRMTETSKKTVEKTTKTVKSEQQLTREIYEKTYELWKDKEVDKKKIFTDMKKEFENDPQKKEILSKKNADSFYIGYYRVARKKKREK